MVPTVKICGLATAATLEAALDAGADMVGLVFFAKSPRFVGLDHARELAAQARDRARIVALTVDADDDAAGGDRRGVVGPDMLQLHGRESAAAGGGDQADVRPAGDEGDRRRAKRRTSRARATTQASPTGC